MTITRQDFEDAARAAGIDVVSRDGDTLEYKPRFETKWITWNPLTSAEDRENLMMKCGMVIDFESGTALYRAGEVAWYSKDFTPGNVTECAEAVVLAAAEQWRSREK